MDVNIMMNQIFQEMVMEYPPAVSAVIAEYACHAYSQNLYNMKNNENAFSFYKTLALNIIIEVIDQFEDDVDNVLFNEYQQLDFNVMTNYNWFMRFYRVKDGNKVNEALKRVHKLAAKHAVVGNVSEVPDS